LQQYLPFTVLKRRPSTLKYRQEKKLQQYLPFTVLKPHQSYCHILYRHMLLQQYLPFTVLKLPLKEFKRCPIIMGCNSTYRLRY